MPWNPDLYEKFHTERHLPFADLLSLVQVRPGLRVIDLGCGTGELSRQLFDALPGCEMVAIDNTPAMLEAAAAYECPGLVFEHADITAVDGEFDLVFSHSSLQWVADHPTLFPQLLRLVKPGGQFIGQMAANHAHYIYRAIDEVAREQPFLSALDGWQRHVPVLPLEEYAELFHRCGMDNIVVMDKIYPHVLPDADSIIDWVEGTALVPYFDRLPHYYHDAFLQSYRARLQTRWSNDDAVFYAFRRVLFAADMPE